MVPQGKIVPPRSVMLGGMKEIRPPHGEGREQWPPPKGCQFGLRWLLLVVMFWAVVFGYSRAVPELFVYVGFAFVAFVAILSFALFGLRD